MSVTAPTRTWPRRSFLVAQVAVDLDSVEPTLLAERPRTLQARAEGAPRRLAPTLTLMTFVVQYCRVEIHPSARRHGSADDDMLHAIEHAMVVDDIGEDPDRWLVIGPDRAGNLLEVIVLVTAEGNEVIIHSMSLRAAYRKLLDL